MEATVISPLVFLEKWKIVCRSRNVPLFNAWNDCSKYTKEIFHVEHAVLGEVARLLNLTPATHYYHLDAIFFEESDRVHCAPTDQTWVKNIRVAFEHENKFNSGLFKEVSHLLVTRADLRVLVSYPQHYDKDAELEKLSQIIGESFAADSDPAFLLILGKRLENSANKIIEWTGYAYQGKKLQMLIN